MSSKSARKRRECEGVDAITFSHDVNRWQFLVNQQKIVSSVFSLVTRVCDPKKTVFTALFEYGKQKPNTDSRQTIQAPTSGAPAVTCHGACHVKRVAK
jgi:hypothetical protein